MQQQTLTHIPVHQLRIAPENVRKQYDPKKDDQLGELTANIKSLGIISPLTVRPHGKSFAIVAGQRRFHALKALVAAGDIDADMEVPCTVRDNQDAIAVSLAENTQRQAMDPLDAYEAFSRLHDKGQSVDAIASSFGCTVNHVRRTLALADVCDDIKALYREGKIDQRDLRAATLGTPERQEAWVKAYQAGKVQTYNIRAFMVDCQVNPSKALFDLSAVEGMAVTTDLFSDRTHITDTERFWEHQNKAIDALIVEHEANGWKVKRFNPNEHWMSYEYEKAAKADGGMVIVDVARDGGVTVKKGLRKKSASTRNSEQPARQRAEIPGDGQLYFDRWRNVMVRADLIKNEHDALALLLVSLAVNHFQMGYGVTTGLLNDELSKDDDPQWQASEDVQAVSTALSELKALSDDYAYGADLVKLYLAFRAMERDELVSKLATFGAMAINEAPFLIDVVGETIGTRAEGRWTADETAIGHFKGKDTSAALLDAIGGEELAAAGDKETIKKRHARAMEALATRDEPWIPPYLQFPMTSLRGGTTKTLETIQDVRDKLNGDGAPETADL